MKRDSEIYWMAFRMNLVAEHTRDIKNVDKAFKVYGKKFGVLNSDKRISMDKFSYVHNMYMNNIDAFKELRKDAALYMDGVYPGHYI